MKTIYKYGLSPADVLYIPMPIGADILCVQMQAGLPNLWAFVENNNPQVSRKIHIRGTGHDCAGAGKYIGTFQMQDGALVLHAFDAGEML